MQESREVGPVLWSSGGAWAPKARISTNICRSRLQRSQAGPAGLGQTDLGSALWNGLGEHSLKPHIQNELFAEELG